MILYRFSYPCGYRLWCRFVHCRASVAIFTVPDCGQCEENTLSIFKIWSILSKSACASKTAVNSLSVPPRPLSLSLPHPSLSLSPLLSLFPPLCLSPLSRSSLSSLSVSLSPPLPPLFSVTLSGLSDVSHLLTSMQLYLVLKDSLVFAA